MSHTPGPWVADTERFNGHCGYEVNAGTPATHTVATVYLWTITSKKSVTENAAAKENAEARANARLIAAAPEMLAALDQALIAMQSVDDWNGGTLGREPLLTMHVDRLAESIALARAAIAKATGRTTEW